MPPKRKITGKPASKKAKVEEVPKTEYDIKLETILNALCNEDYPIEGGESNREMLILGAPCVYEEFVENRHANQGTMGGFIDEAFIGIRKSLEEKLADQLKIQETGDARRAELVTAVESSTTILTEKEAALETCKTTLGEKKDLLTEAKALLKDAKANQKGIDSELGAAEFDLDKFTKGQGWFIALRDNGPDKTMLKDIKSILTDLKLEGKNTECHTILGRTLDLRGMFDSIVFKHVTEKFTGAIAECNRTILEIKTRGADIINTTATCETRVSECMNIVIEAENAVTEAKTATGEAKFTLKECEKAVRTHDTDVACAEERKLECEVALGNFTKIEESLTWLKVRTAPIPEPEIIEDDKPAEDVEMPAAETTAETTEAPAAEITATTEPIIEEPLVEEPMMDAPMDSIAV